MPTFDKRTVPAGSTVEIVVDHPKLGIGKPKPRPPALHDRPGTPPYVEPVSMELYDLGVFYNDEFDPTTNEIKSQYTETSLEVSNLLNATDLARVRGYLLANLGEVTVAHSDRPTAKAFRLQSASTETDGTITTVKYEQNGTVRNGNPLGETQEWARKVPNATRAADLTDFFATLPSDDESRPSIAEAIARALHETWERWRPQSATRVGADGTLRKRLTEGRWGIGIDSYVAYQPWLSWDETNFKTTSEPRASADAATFPQAISGAGQSTRYRVFMAPQMLQWQCRWTALYEYYTLFTQGTFWLFAVTQWCDRLPFFPWAFQLSEVGNGANWTTVSRRISHTQHYRALLALDEAVQVFSGYLIVVLAARLAGRWSIRFRDIAANTLCARVEAYYNGATTSVDRYIWRRTARPRTNDLLERGELNTEEVTGYDGGFPFVED